MRDYVGRQDVLVLLDKIERRTPDSKEWVYQEARHEILNMPPAAVREVVYGKWRKVYPTYELNIIARNHEPCYVCSKCNAHVDVKTPFCPICGAVMREEE